MNLVPEGVCVGFPAAASVKTEKQNQCSGFHSGGVYTVTYSSLCVSTLRPLHSGSPSVCRRRLLCAHRRPSHSGTLRSCTLTDSRVFRQRSDKTNQLRLVLFALLLQHISSLRSPQSSTPSHVWFLKMHFSFTQVNSHSAIKRRVSDEAGLLLLAGNSSVFLRLANFN